jgi:hypothetical protein
MALPVDVQGFFTCRKGDVMNSSKKLSFVAALFLTTSLAMGGGGDMECSKFAKLLSQPEASRKLDSMVLEPKINSKGEESYEDLDIDGDGTVDRLIGGCAASIPAADPCVLLLTLSTGKAQEFNFRNQERFFLVRIDSRVYAIANSNNPGKRSIISLDSNGIIRICDNL